jgi:hypothetical protein
MLIGGAPVPRRYIGSSSSNNRRRSSSVWQIWTLDPGGGMRHWGGGATAIGRQAPLVRKHLAREFMLLLPKNDNVSNNDIAHQQQQQSTSKTCTPSARKALEMALSACRNAMMSEEDTNHGSDSTTSTSNSGHSYKAMLFWWNSRGRLCIGQILPEDVQKCQERIRQLGPQRKQA